MDRFVWLGEVSFDNGVTWFLEQEMRAVRQLFLRLFYPCPQCGLINLPCKASFDSMVLAALMGSVLLYPRSRETE